MHKERVFPGEHMWLAIISFWAEEKKLKAFQSTYALGDLYTITTCAAQRKDLTEEIEFLHPPKDFDVKKKLQNEACHKEHITYRYVLHTGRNYNRYTKRVIG